MARTVSYLLSPYSMQSPNGQNQGRAKIHVSNKQSRSRRLRERFFAPLSLRKESGKAHRDSGVKIPTPKA
jgi:hypothetical protein